jgi:citrate lyase gamma subunit
MLELQVDTAQLETLAIELMSTEKQFDRALRSTVGKMVKWVKTRSVRIISKDANIPQRIARRRIKALKAKKTSEGTEMQIFYGENPVGLIYLKPKKTSTGITATGRTVAGAFKARGKGGQDQVFKRIGKSRLPLAKQTTEVKEPFDSVLNREFINASAFAEQFFKVLEHELQWQTQR